MGRCAVRLGLILLATALAGVAHAEIRFAARAIGRPGGKQYGQTSLVDVDKDGDLDFISGENAGRIFWFEYQGPDNWVRHLLAATAATEVGGTAVDVDGDLDVFSCEGPLGGSGPGKTWQWYVWENLDGKGGAFKEHIVLQGKEGHGAVCAGVDGDGDIDICTKPWNGDEHIYLENLAKPGGR
jgi:hypothetical protein